MRSTTWVRALAVLCSLYSVSAAPLPRDSSLNAVTTEQSFLPPSSLPSTLIDISSSEGAHWTLNKRETDDEETHDGLVSQSTEADHSLPLASVAAKGEEDKEEDTKDTDNSDQKPKLHTLAKRKLYYKRLWNSRTGRYETVRVRAPDSDSESSSSSSSDSEDDYPHAPLRRVQRPPARQDSRPPPRPVYRAPPRNYDPVPPRNYDPVPPRNYDPVPPRNYDPVPPRNYDPVPPRNYDPVPPRNYDPVPARSHGSVAPKMYPPIPPKPQAQPKYYPPVQAASQAKPKYYPPIQSSNKGSQAPKYASTAKDELLSHPPPSPPLRPLAKPIPVPANRPGGGHWLTEANVAKFLKETGAAPEEPR